jgi:RpiR family carbohydrate utilization transcriptional regulator
MKALPHPAPGANHALSLDIVSRIAGLSAGLPPSERKIAALVLRDVEAAGALPIGTLAERAGVGAASVTRFALSLGCRDVRELKRELVRAGAIGARFLAATAPDKEPDSAEVVHREIVELLSAHRALIDLGSMRRAARLLRKARMVYAYGVGGWSAVMADEARIRLVRLGLPVASYQDAVMQRVAGATMDRHCALLALSLTGRTSELLEAVTVARGYGARVVAITAPGSPLARLAEVVLPVVSRETDAVLKPSSARYAALMMLDVLATEVARTDPVRSRELLRRIKVVLDAHRGGPDRQPLGD